MNDPVAAEREERVDAAIAEFLQAEQSGTPIDRAEFLARNSDIAADLAEFFTDRDQFAGIVNPMSKLIRETQTGGFGNDLPTGDYSGAGNGPLAPTELAAFGELEEIARGGMGIVYRCHDAPLRRDLALKVLQDQHRRSPEQVRRFIEEAQIAARLQHPGVVPIHGIGRLADGRPYFTMKLVRGRTLSELLRERPPGADAAALASELPRFLHVFEQVCQPIAFAHSQGVIHRDLKPSNVMVGAFGEVQVMDWGLAKEMRNAEWGMRNEEAGVDPMQGSGARADQTRAGAVLGTPAYMAPEQARGEIDQIDRRSDVFGLGAILCEILTGKPPYWGEDWLAVHLRARNADIADALARLNCCGADTELVQLAVRCLHADPATRPADGAEVAREITGYEASVQERLRRAEVEKATVAAKAAQERRARRLVVALAAAVVVVFAIGGGAWMWVKDVRATQRAERVLKGEAELATATRLRDEVQTTDNPAKLAEGLAAARRGAEMFDDGSPALQKARTLIAQFEEWESDRNILPRLEQASLLQPVRADEPGDTNAVFTAYAAAFRESGIDVESLDVEVAAERIRSRYIAGRLAAALDAWVALSPPGWRHLDAIARAADPERNPLRDAIARYQITSLQEMAASLNVATTPPATIRLVADTLSAQARPAALSLLRRAAIVHGRDFWISYRLAGHLLEQTPPEIDDAILWYANALSLNSASAGVRLDFARALQERSRTQDALQRAREAVRLKPDYAAAHNELARVLLAKHEYAEAETSCRTALRIWSNFPAARHLLGRILLEQKRVGEAIPELRRAAELDASSVEAAHDLGYALLQSPVSDQRLSTEGRAPNSPFPNDAIPKRVNAITEAEQHLKRAVEGDPRFARAHHTLGMAIWARSHYSSDRVKETTRALGELREAVRLDASQADAWYDLGHILALGYQNEVEAANALATAARIRPDYYDAHLWLGYVLSRKVLKAGAISAFTEAMRLRPEKPEPYTQLAECHYADGDWQKAFDNMNVALRLRPNDVQKLTKLADWLREAERYDEETAIRRKIYVADRAQFHHLYKLCHAALAAGRASEARDLLQEWIAASGRKPSDNSETDREFQRWAEREKQLPAVLQGEMRPPNELGEMAWLCVLQAKHADAAQLYGTAAMAAPDILQVQSPERRIRAARSLLLAAGEGGDEKSDALRFSRIRLALSWLHAEIKELSERAEESPSTRGEVLRRLRGWYNDPALRVLLDVGSLPAPERERAQKLWASVQKLLAWATRQD